MYYLNQQDHHPNHDQNTPKQYLNSLSSNDISQLYYSGQQKWNNSLWSQFKILMNIDGYLSQLANFYPYQTTVTTTHKNYRSDLMCAVQEGLAVSAVSFYGIYQMGRRGKVLPFLRQYGSYFKTHRVFRHYVHALVLPTLLFTSLVDFQYINLTTKLWSTHARRLNEKKVSDPKGSYYPESILPDNWVEIWRTTYVSPLDRPAKKANETQIFLSEYEPEEFETVQIGGGEEGEGQGEAQEQE